jgi:hypothetical protein
MSRFHDERMRAATPTPAPKQMDYEGAIATLNQVAAIKGNANTVPAQEVVELAQAVLVIVGVLAKKGLL